MCIILEAEFTDTDMHSNGFHIIGADLGDIELLSEKIKKCGIEPSLPTLFLAEYVLLYMDDTCTDTLMQWITQSFQSACFISCDLVRPKSMIIIMNFLCNSELHLIKF